MHVAFRQTHPAPGLCDISSSVRGCAVLSKHRSFRHTDAAIARQGRQFSLSGGGKKRHVQNTDSLNTSPYCCDPVLNEGLITRVPPIRHDCTAPRIIMTPNRAPGLLTSSYGHRSRTSTPASISHSTPKSAKPLARPPAELQQLTQPATLPLQTFP